jgi:hypothetical protein
MPEINKNRGTNFDLNEEDVSYRLKKSIIMPDQRTRYNKAVMTSKGFSQFKFANNENTPIITKYRTGIIFGIFKKSLLLGKFLKINLT